MAMAVVYGNFGGMLVAENRGGTQSDYVADTLGSVATVLNSSGSAAYTAEYWPYGEVRTSSGSNTSPWSFGGLLGYFADGNDTYYVRARHYMAPTAQWLVRDPIWPFLPAFAYAGGRPIDKSDPSGLLTMEQIKCCFAKSGMGGIIDGIVAAGAACLTCIGVCLVGLGLPGVDITFPLCMAACADFCGGEAVITGIVTAILAGLGDLLKCLFSDECLPKPNPSCLEQCKNIPPGHAHGVCMRCCFYGCGPDPQPWQPFKPVACATPVATSASAAV